MSLIKKIVVASLTALFVVFSVGLPVVQYFCPMAGMDRDCCEMTPVGSELAFTSGSTSCCGTTIVAERNTTPYLEVVKYQPASFDFQSTLNHSLSSFESPAAATVMTASHSHDRGAPPLFLQHSALLL